jgi:hypothetical protein
LIWAPTARRSPARQLGARPFSTSTNRAAGFNPELPVVLLGRLDFFNHFKVLFDERARIFTLERYETHEPRRFDRQILTQQVEYVR